MAIGDTASGDLAAPEAPEEAEAPEVPETAAPAPPDAPAEEPESAALQPEQMADCAPSPPVVGDPDADCGQCEACADKVKFGGPGRKRKGCFVRAAANEAGLNYFRGAWDVVWDPPLQEPKSS